MLRRAWIGWTLVVLAGPAACHHAPPPAPPAAQRMVHGPNDLVGSWVRSDDLDFGYTLSFDGKGHFRQRIDRGRMGVCEQDGQLAAGPAPRTLAFTFAHDTCDEGGTGATRTLEVQSYTTDELSVVVRGGVAPLARRYTPDPKAATAAGSLQQ